MYKILTLNKIAECGLERMPKSKYTITDQVAEDVDGIILRSFSMHDMELPKGLKAVARAGAGTNNIPIPKCTEEGIVVFNTPGANANGVKEAVICGMLLASRKINEGIEWAKELDGDDVAKQVEKGKSSFAGGEIRGKTLGIIGLGAIGVLVANAAIDLGMKVIGYDPYLSVNAAWNLNSAVKKANSMDEIFENSDYITLHVPLNDETRDTIDKEAIEKMKDGVRILNFARGPLVNSDDIKKAISDGKVACYVVDFPDETTINQPGIIAIPHLGASTQESEDNCAIMAADQISDFLENGNITNSVNFPACSLSIGTAGRVSIIHKNIPNMITKFTTVFSTENANISDMINKSKGDFAYTIINVDHHVTDEIADKLREIDGVLNVRVLR